MHFGDCFLLFLVAIMFFKILYKYILSFLMIFINF